MMAKLLLIITICLLLTACPKPGKTEFADVTKAKHHAVTQLGAKVYYTNRVTPDMLAAIDRGLADLCAAARRPGMNVFNSDPRPAYFTKTEPKDFTIYLLPADREYNVDGQYDPAFRVSPVPAPFKDSIYDHNSPKCECPTDKGDFMYNSSNVPEGFLAHGQASMVTTEQDRDLALLERTVRYEAEHIVLYFNDQGAFRVTLDHFSYPHPILK